MSVEAADSTIKTHFERDIPDIGCNGGSHNYSAPKLEDSQGMKPGEEHEPKWDSDSGRSCEMVVKNVTVQVDKNGNLTAEESKMDGSSTEPVSPGCSDIPLLTRIDRLDIVLDYLEDKTFSHPTASKGNYGHLSSGLEDKALQRRCKPISWVLEETEAKGTIVERIAILEERVRELRSELDPKSLININGGADSRVRLHLNGGKGCDIFVEEKKQAEAVLPPPRECVQKGLHERVFHLLDVPKNDRSDVEALSGGRNGENLKKVTAKKEESHQAVRYESKNKGKDERYESKNKSKEEMKKNKGESGYGKGSKRRGKLGRMAQCIFPRPR